MGHKNNQSIRTTHENFQKSKIISSPSNNVDNLFSFSHLFLRWGLSIMCWLFLQWQELSGDTQYAGVPLDQSGLRSSCPTSTHNWHHNRHNYGRCQWKCPPSAPHEALHSMLMCQIDRWQPPEQVDIFFWVVEGVYGPQRLLCSSYDASPQHHWSSLRAVYTLNTTKNYTPMLGGLSPIHSRHMRRVQGFMWGARGPFLPAVAMVGCGCVGRCWPLEAMSDWPTVGIVKNVYRSIFIFWCRSHTLLTSDPEAKKWRLRPLHFAP